MTRRAPIAEKTSDVTRFSGLLIGAIVAGLVTAVAALWASGRSANGAPGPLSRTHSAAKLSCESCHRSEPAAKSCSGCHGAHKSSRPGHLELASAGALGCADCHQIHVANSGVRLTADGRALRYAPGAEVDVTSLVALRQKPAAEIRVPVIEVSACERCHDPSAARDPIARCLAPPTAGFGGRRPSLCFDEHEPAGGPRDGVWEAAREVALVAPVAPGPPRPGSGPWSWLGLGLVSATLCFGGAQLARRAQSRMRTAHDAPVEPPKVIRLPTINAATCIGCYACVDACPYDVIEIHNYVAQVVRPADCCGLTLCEQRCPNGSLTMGDGVVVTGEVEVDGSLQSEAQPGVYLAGDITGMPLIRNAINQGAHAVREIASSLGRAERRGEGLDLVVVGAGPAGLSASLEAKARGLRYLTLEQSTVAASIRSFPRGKLVFDQPLDIPLIGELWLEESTKEELVGQWLRIARSENLNIAEGRRVTGIERRGDRFEVSFSDADGARDAVGAKRVLLAIGRRGTPRQLAIDIPDSVADRVFYSLADARSFAGQRVLVVGLGDVAMEAACALSRQPGTQVAVSYRGSKFQRGKARNIRDVERRVAAGAIDLYFDSELSALEPGCARLAHSGETVTVPCDAVFVLIGSIPPTEFLERAGLSTQPRSQT